MAAATGARAGGDHLFVLEWIGGSGPCKWSANWRQCTLLLRRPEAAAVASAAGSRDDDSSWVVSCRSPTLSVSRSLLSVSCSISPTLYLSVSHRNLLLFSPFFSCFYPLMTPHMVPATSDFLRLGHQSDEFGTPHP